MSIRQLSEVWPKHAGHDIIYSEHGRTDYQLIDVEVLDDDLDFIVSPNHYDTVPVYGDINETETWCRDCGVVLPTFFERVGP